MIIKLKPDITPEDRNRLLNIIQESGTDYGIQDTENQSEIYINEAYSGLNQGFFSHLPGVESVTDGEPIYKLVSRDYKKSDTIIQLEDLFIGGNNFPVMIAGPCAVENEDQIRETALLVRSRGVRIMRGGAYKPRTSPYSFTGLEEKGLELLGKVKEETGLFIITEVMDTADVEVVAAYSDILQIGSRNMQNYKLLKAVGCIRKPVLLKRGMSARLDEFLGSAEYIMKGGNEQVMLCERGIRTFVEYSRNTLDLNVVPVIKSVSHLPIFVDPSHGTGRRDLIVPMSLAGLAAGADGIMVEVHPDPDNSWSDPEQALSPEQFSILVEKFTQFVEWRYKNASVTTAP